MHLSNKEKQVMMNVVNTIIITEGKKRKKEKTKAKEMKKKKKRDK